MRRYRWVAAVAVLLALPVLVHATPREATDKELAAVKRALENRLKDAESSRLKDVLVEGEYVCGLVNAKNSYGAYAGYSHFVGMLFAGKDGKPPIAIVVGIGDKGIEAQMCANKGIPLPPL